MSGAKSRRKGMVAERELCKLLTGELGILVQRNVDQARAGGADCLQVPGFAIECKRTEAMSKPAWWRQAVEQGQAACAEPIVFFRRSHEPWQALIRKVDGGYRDASFEEAVMHVREKLARLHGVWKEAA